MANSCGWQQQASYPLNYNGYTTPAALHQEATTSSLTSFGACHQFQGYSAAAAAAAMGHMNAAAANHLASQHGVWTNRASSKSEVVSSSSNVSSHPQNTSTWSAAPMSVDSYSFFSPAATHHPHAHHMTVQHSNASSASGAFANPLSGLNPHSPTEPKSGYPYYGHQISGMEASMLCAGRVH